VHWPDIDGAIEEHVSVCNMYSSANQKEPLLQHSVPMHPWQTVGADYFTISNQDYVLIVDYFSKYPEMQGKTAEHAINVLKATLAYLTHSLLTICHLVAKDLHNSPKSEILTLS